MHLAFQIWTSLKIPNLSGFCHMKNKFKDSWGMFKQITLFQDSYHKNLRC